MDKFQKHFIYKLEFDITYPDRATAFELKEDISYWIQSDLDKKLNRVFDEFSHPLKTITLNTVELDLGNIHKSKLRDAIRERLPEVLRRELKELFTMHYLRPEPDDPQVMKQLQRADFSYEKYQEFIDDKNIIVLDPSVQRLQNLRQFLETGTLPLPALKEEKAFSELLSEMKKEQPEVLSDVVVKSVKKGYVRERLIKQLGKKGGDEIVKIIAPKESKEAILIKDRIISHIERVLPEIGRVELQDIKEEIEQDVIKYFVERKSAIFDKTEFVAEIVGKMARKSEFLVKSVKKNIDEIIGRKDVEPGIPIADQLQDLVDKLTLAVERNKLLEIEKKKIALDEIAIEPEGEISLTRAFQLKEEDERLAKVRLEVQKEIIKRKKEQEDLLEAIRIQREKAQKEEIRRKSEALIKLADRATKKEKAEKIETTAEEKSKVKQKESEESELEKKTISPVEIEQKPVKEAQRKKLEIDMDDWAHTYSPAEILTFVEGQDLEQLELFFQELEKRRAEIQKQIKKQEVKSPEIEPKDKLPERVADPIFVPPVKSVAAEPEVEEQESFESAHELVKIDSTIEESKDMEGPGEEVRKLVQDPEQADSEGRIKEPEVEEPSTKKKKSKPEDAFDPSQQKTVEYSEEGEGRESSEIKELEQFTELLKRREEIAEAISKGDSVDQYYDEEKERRKLWQVLIQIEELKKKIKKIPEEEEIEEKKVEQIEEMVEPEQKEPEVAMDLETFVREKMPERVSKKKSIPIPFNKYLEFSEQDTYPIDLAFAPRKELLIRVKSDRILDIRPQRLMDIFQFVIFYRKAPWWSEENEIDRLESDILSEMATLKEEIKLFFTNLFSTYSSKSERELIIRNIFQLFSLRFIDQLFTAIVPKASKYFVSLRKWLKKIYATYTDEPVDERISRMLFDITATYYFSKDMNVRFFLEELKKSVLQDLGISKRQLGLHYNQFLLTEENLYQKEKETAKRYWKSKTKPESISRHKDRLKKGIPDEDESFSFQDLLIYMIQFGTLPPASGISTQSEFETLLRKYLQENPDLIKNVLENADREGFILHTFFSNISEDIYEALIRLIYPIRGMELVNLIKRIIKVRNTDLKMKFYIGTEIYRIHLVDYILRFNESVHTVQNYIKDLIRFMVREKGLSPRLSLEYYKRVFEFVVYDDDRLEEIMAYLKIIENNIAKLPKRRQRAEPEKDPFDEPLPEVKTGTEYYVRNAGLVILWPFLSTYFSRLGMLGKNKKFIDVESQHRAAHLLQYLVAKQTQTPEFELVLNKVMVGLDPTTPIDLEIELTEKEFTTSESLLNSVIKQWTALKSTSIDGLRGAFLVREGKLTKRTDSWLLQVETKPYDILLDKMPWGMSMVRISWMDMIMRVDWR